jgi:hypothetical protein
MGYVGIICSAAHCNVEVAVQMVNTAVFELELVDAALRAEDDEETLGHLQRVDQTLQQILSILTS